MQTRPSEAVPATKARVGAVVLAAGLSRRAGGRQKAVFPVDGVPMVRRVVSRLLEADIHPIGVVVGHEADEVLRALSDVPVQPIHCPGYRAGMGVSLAAGVRALGPRVDGLFVALADMPYVRASTLRALRPVAETAARVPTYRGRWGHPVLFGAAWFARLSALTGDRGARRLLEADPAQVERVPVEDEGIVLDLDTPAAP